jgi:uroporphyrinogen-III synthase
MPSLAGRRIVVTRRAGQASSLVGLLRERGAEVVEVPAIEIVPPADTAVLDESLRALCRFQWLVFTSANAVEAVAARLRALGLPGRLASQGSELASVGPATTAALRQAFPDDRVRIEPARDFRGVVLASEIARQSRPGARALLPCSSRAREELPTELRALGIEVLTAVAYETVEPPDLGPRVTRCVEEGFDLVLFASPSAAEAFARAAGERGRGLPAVAIGPTTAEAVRAAGLSLRGTAERSTAEGLVAVAERVLACPPCPAAQP